MQFVDTLPPRQGFAGRPWKHEAESVELKKRPGAWALVEVYGKAQAASAAAGSFKKRGFESATRRQDDGKTALYARFVAA